MRAFVGITKSKKMSETVRFFKCISNKGVFTNNVKNYFTIGKVYEEANFDIFGNKVKREDFENQENTVATVFLGSEYATTDGYKVPFYVDLTDFELVPVISGLCLN